MANAITRAQIITLERLTGGFPDTEEIKVAHRYASGNLVVYTKEATMDIFPNGNWRLRSPQTGEKIFEGKFRR